MSQGYGNSGARVVVDPGHGGDVQVGNATPHGVRGPSGTLERDVTLRVARQLVAGNGADFALTREGNDARSLANRLGVAQSSQADVFLSIHANAGPPGARGSELYVHPESGEGSRRLANALADALQGAGRATLVQHAQLASIHPRWLPEHTAACLVELDYLSDPTGERELNDPTATASLVQALQWGIRAFLGQPGQEYGRRARRYGAVTVTVGSPDWVAQARQAFDGGETVVLVLTDDFARQFIADVVNEALRRGWNLVEPGVDLVRQMLDAIRSTASEIIDYIEDKVKQHLPWPLSEAFALPALAVVVIVVAALFFIFLLAREGLRFLSDDNVNEIIRYCAERGEVDVEIYRDDTSGFDVSGEDREGGVRISGNGWVRIHCTPR